MSDAHAIIVLRILIGVVVFAILCGLCILIPELRSRWILRQEIRAIEKREADMRKWGLLDYGYGKETRRIPAEHVDATRGQFAESREVWDKQGVHR